MMADNAASIRNGVDDTIENLVPDEQPKKVTKLTCYPHLKGPHGALHKNKSKIKKGDECYERMKIDVMKLHQVPAGLAIYVITVLFSLLVAKWNKNDEEAWASWLSTYWRVGVHWSRAYGVPGKLDWNRVTPRRSKVMEVVLRLPHVAERVISLSDRGCVGETSARVVCV